MIINAINPHMRKQSQNKNTFGAKFDDNCIGIILRAAELKKISHPQAIELVKIHFDQSTGHLGIIKKEDKDIVEISLVNKKATSEEIKKGIDSFPLHFVNYNNKNKDYIKNVVNNLTEYFSKLNLKTVKDTARENLDHKIPEENTKGVLELLFKAFNSKNGEHFLSSLEPSKNATKENPFIAILKAD